MEMFALQQSNYHIYSCHSCQDESLQSPSPTSEGNVSVPGVTARVLVKHLYGQHRILQHASGLVWVINATHISTILIPDVRPRGHQWFPSLPTAMTLHCSAWRSTVCLHVPMGLQLANEKVLNYRLPSVGKKKKSFKLHKANSRINVCL